MFKLLLIALAISYAASAGVKISSDQSAINEDLDKCFSYLAQQESSVSIEAWTYMDPSRKNSHFEADYNASKANGVNETDAFVTICSSVDADDMVNQIVDALPSSYSDKLWLQFDWAWCHWNGTAAQNLTYMETVTTSLLNKGFDLGIIMEDFSWKVLTGSKDTVSEVLSKLPLWYQGLNNQPNFGDFQKFGGWETPTRKAGLFGDILCAGSLMQPVYSASSVIISS